jgi:succinate dehydrogenase membrane anchor subunit
MVNRVFTGAHYGLRDWLMQRITAVVMAVYLLLLAGYLLMQPYVDYDVWTALFSSQVVLTFTMLFLLSLFYHAWVGIRDIVMDYVKPAWMRLLIHVLVIMALLLYAIWAVEIFWGM